MARAAGAKPPAVRANTPPGVVNTVHTVHTHQKTQNSKALVKRPDDYSSDGVKDNDVFLLPMSDYYVMFGLTLVAAAVRLFRIYQPTSVVFDEVQFVYLLSINGFR
jgi:dolichyl-phosphate-mannose-protein mannosyltransferase